MVRVEVNVMPSVLNGTESLIHDVYYESTFL